MCQVGDQLELMCTTPAFHMWRFTAIQSGSATNYTRTVSPVGSAGVSSQPFTINSTITITFSRLSNQSSLPLISRMLINSVSEGLNGVQVECIAEPEVATTTVHIIGGRLPWLVNLHSCPNFLCVCLIVTLLIGLWTYSV